MYLKTWWMENAMHNARKLCCQFFHSQLSRRNSPIFLQKTRHEGYKSVKTKADITIEGIQALPAKAGLAGWHLKFQTAYYFSIAGIEIFVF